MDLRARTALRRNGFTLLEILIVVAILGLLASIVFSMVRNVLSDTRKGAFIADVRTYAQAAYLYMGETGQLLEDSSSGVFPVGWEDYVDPDDWEGGTPIGGVWDMERDGFPGMAAGFGVHFFGVPNPGDAYMLDIDKALDDGDLATGGFRKIAADRYYFVLITE